MSQDCDECKKEIIDGSDIFDIEVKDGFEYTSDEIFCSRECAKSWAKKNLTLKKHELIGAGHYAEKEAYIPLWIK